MFIKLLFSLSLLSITGVAYAANSSTANWLLKISWNDPGADFYQECRIDKSGKVVFMNKENQLKRPAIEKFDRSGIEADIMDAQKYEVKSNKSSVSNKEKFDGLRSKKEYFANVSKTPLLLRHEELEYSSQNVSPSTDKLIQVIDAACGTATHKKM